MLDEYLPVIRETLVHPDMITNIKMRNIVRVHPVPLERCLPLPHAELRLACLGEGGQEGAELVGEHDVIRGEWSEYSPVDREQIHQIISVTNLRYNIDVFFAPYTGCPKTYSHLVGIC